MFELKEGMKFKTLNIEKIFTVFKKVEELLGNTYWIDEYIGYDDESIDWEETAKLNGIDLDFEKEKKLYIDTCIENGMSIEKAIIECDIVSEKFNPKHDKDKLDWTLLPINEVEEIVKVLDFGKQKYSAHAWKCVENAQERYLSATYRHLVEYTKGNKIDSESGLSHLSHLATNILFLMWFENNKEE